MAGKYLKGALVNFISASASSGPVPNVLVFQYNPETIQHGWSQPAQSAAPGKSGSNALAAQGVPGETFSFSLALDASDDLAEPRSLGGIVARTSGVYARLAALEMLLHPPRAASGLVGGTGGVRRGERRAVPASQLPMVLFVWGKGRILPVRVTSLSITEKLYDSDLNPTHADAQIELRVLTPDDRLGPASDPLVQVATAAYRYSQGQREVLAMANLGNAAESILPVLARALSRPPTSTG